MSQATTAQMMGDLLRDDRYAAVVTAAFDINDVNLLTVKGEERLGQPFAYEVRLSSSQRIRTFAKVPGQRMTVGFKLRDGSTRYIDGLINRFDFAGIDDTRSPIYVAELVPWLTFLAYRRNSRIFQNQTSLDIIKTIFDEHGGRFANETRTPPPKRPFCVQYDETDLDFVSRLMEQDGIYYFFSHAEGRHQLVLCDGPASHDYCSPPTVETNLNLEPYRVQNDIIWKWSETVSAQPARVVLDDYNHETLENLHVLRDVPSALTGGVPTMDEQQAATRLARGPSPVQRERTDPGAGGKQAVSEIFSYPGRYLERSHGEFYARIQTEEIASRSYRAVVTGSPRQVTTGCIFKAADPYEITDNNLAPRPTVVYLAIATRITLKGDLELGRDEDKKPFLYKAEIEIQPKTTPFRPPRRTPAPIIHGPQTAVCVGRKSEVITTDALGRIKVQFYWDRKGKKDENSSIWIRVAQSWAGKNFGGLITPRVGQEVVVSFINGNPDWPLVVGTVYNKAHEPPERLPRNASRSTFRTRTEKGTVAEYNELSFEDKRGSEEVFLRAQKDYRVAVGDRYAVDVAKEYSLNMQLQPHPLADEPGEPFLLNKPLGSYIEMTPRTISFTVNGGPIASTLELGQDGISLIVRGPAGPQVIEIGPEGIAVAGTAIGMMANIVTSMPFPLPKPSQQAVEARIKANLPLSNGKSPVP